jgi:hypothetical protein
MNATNICGGNMTPTTSLAVKMRKATYISCEKYFI